MWYKFGCKICLYNTTAPQQLQITTSSKNNINMNKGPVQQPIYELCEPWQCVIGDPKDTQHVPFHSAFEHTTHSVLRVPGPYSPIPGKIPVNIFNASNGTSVPFELERTSTIGDLKQMFLKMKPEFGGDVNLAYNGKPVKKHQTLAELQVKAGASFITFQKCNGG